MNLTSTYFHSYDVYMFDLDNTLFSELDYLDIAYRDIANSLASRYSVSNKEVFDFLHNEFSVIGRNQLFNKTYAFFNTKSNIDESEEIFVNWCLSTLRSVESPEPIYLYKYAYNILEYLKRSNKRIVVVTNGNVQQQKNKVRLIDWKGLNKNIDFVYANLYAPKPDPKSFNEYIKSRYFLNKERGIFIGDSESDEKYANAIQQVFMHSNELSSFNV